jgi:5'-nucleotidase
VSNGLSYSWDAKHPAGAAPGAGHRVVPGSLRLHGEPIAMEKSYRVTLNSFMAGGGDALSIFNQGRSVQEGESDLVVAKLYFRLKGILPQPQTGRIQRLN